MLLENPLRFTPELLERPKISGIDVISTLEHFAIITYLVDPQILASHIHQRFEVVCIRSSDGTPRGLVSVVPFHDADFRFARFPYLSFAFGQTNYRAYVRPRNRNALRLVLRDYLRISHCWIAALCMETAMAFWTVSIRMRARREFMSPIQDDNPEQLGGCGAKSARPRRASINCRGLRISKPEW